MNDVILKRIAILSLLSLLLAVFPKITFAQIIYGFEQASHFNTTHHGPFSINAGTFRSTHSASELRNKIAAQTEYPVRVISTGELHAVVLGPLPSPETVRTAGRTLLNKRALVSNRQRSLVSPVTALPNTSLPPQTDSLASGFRVTVLAGAGSSTLDKQGQIVFPAETFRTDSFSSSGNKIKVASAIGISYDKFLEFNNDKTRNILHGISLGVNTYYNESSRNGSVYEYSLPDFNNSTYGMKVKSWRVMLDTEWVLHSLVFGVMPFVEAGIGGAQNIMSFKNIPRPDIGVDGGNYNLRYYSSVHFAYEFGAGFKIPISTHFIASARYLFADAGKAKSDISDSATGVVLALPVRTSVQSQSVLFGLSYLFG